MPKRGRETNEYADIVAAKKEAMEMSKVATRLRNDFEHDLAKNIKTNPKAFWKYSSSQMKTKEVL